MRAWFAAEKWAQSATRDGSPGPGDLFEEVRKHTAS
jgi:hypothetical protein